MPTLYAEYGSNPTDQGPDWWAEQVAAILTRRRVATPAGTLIGRSVAGDTIEQPIDGDQGSDQGRTPPSDTAEGTQVTTSQTAALWAASGANAATASATIQQTGPA